MKKYIILSFVLLLLGCKVLSVVKTKVTKSKNGNAFPLSVQGSFSDEESLSYHILTHEDLDSLDLSELKRTRIKNQSLDVKLYKKIDSLESKMSFNELSYYDIENKGLKMFDVMTYSFFAICYVDAQRIENVEPDFISLKRTMTSLDSISSSRYINEFERIQKMFNKIYEKINLKKGGDNLRTDEMLNGIAGDSYDVVTTFYTLFTYYGINCGFVFGEISGKNGGCSQHVWLRILSESIYFDLDPTLYPFFIPLKERTGGDYVYQSEHERIKEKYKQPKMITYNSE
jgi:hypothetical protein